MPNYEKLYFELVNKLRVLLPPDTEEDSRLFKQTYTERMAILEQLYSKNLITRDEYDRKRQRVLDEL